MCIILSYTMFNVVHTNYGYQSWPKLIDTSLKWTCIFLNHVQISQWMTSRELVLSASVWDVSPFSPLQPLVTPYLRQNDVYTMYLTLINTWLDNPHNIKVTYLSMLVCYTRYTLLWSTCWILGLRYFYQMLRSLLFSYTFPSLLKHSNYSD